MAASMQQTKKIFMTTMTPSETTTTARKVRCARTFSRICVQQPLSERFLRCQRFHSIDSHCFCAEARKRGALNVAASKKRKAEPTKQSNKIQTLFRKGGAPGSTHFGSAPLVSA